MTMTSSWTFDFVINLGSLDAGADGITFVIHNDPRGRCVCGTAGSQMGAGGIANSLIIEIDTYMNDIDLDDFCGADALNCTTITDWDHLDVWKNGSISPDLDGNCNVTTAGERVVPCAVPLKYLGGLYNIENGLNHIFRLNWNAPTTTLTATVLNMAATITYGTVSYTFNPLSLFGTNTPYFGLTGSTGGAYNQQGFCEPSLLFLPIELMYFNTSCVEGKSKLEWATQTEANSSHFAIEKSSDGINYSLIAIVPAAGNSSSPVKYSFNDEENNLTANTYYLLKEIDVDGNTQIFTPAVSLCKMRRVEVGAVSFDEGILSVQISSGFSGNNASFLVYNALGKILFSGNALLQEGTQQLHFSSQLFSGGMYFLKVNCEDQSQVKKFIVR